MWGVVKNILAGAKRLCSLPDAQRTAVCSGRSHIVPSGLAFPAGTIVSNLHDSFKIMNENIVKVSYNQNEPEVISRFFRS